MLLSCFTIFRPSKKDLFELISTRIERSKDMDICNNKINK